MLDHYLVWAVVFLALAFDYINGFHDTANAIATSVSTRAINPKTAVMMTAVLNFLGAMISTGVAKTIGGDLVMDAKMIDSGVICAALIGAIAWNLLTWWWGIPSSSSHALIGGVIGAVGFSVGFDALNEAGIIKIFLSLVISPIIAMVGGFIIMKVLLLLFGRFSPIALNDRFRTMQVLSATLMAFSHGSNDAQKAMGIITLTLLSGGYIDTLDVPTWVKISCAMAMALGTAAGGWRIISTMGNKIFKMETINGFAADLNSAITIFTATFLHLPVSTTHVVSGSIMGVGSSKRVKAVNWGVARSMVMAWFVTIPLSGLVAACTYWIGSVIF
ncbi:inorganic phosphate transporter [Veillonella sp. YH-vei2232]|jgi:PiT family inorganic phosphate transporter|uniref:Inorganic phosphate transporter n=1 Tax=Veillonella absiana TaxID=3079305 RepID=A0ABU3Z9N4_9FIRM|nr:MULTISPECIES: inorganic phosphate transporter [unclassified Veillonella]NCB95102.1 inorganic phosphate transporter [Negativicutes bacterium]MBP8615953.1 inorganic phosphate transporter [Veillonella sp.]MBP9517611.1 inorganic phosphate transporter [Veillonella sp.]MDV5063155.1 inorganic phosphate transporter [Veillonella sp. YH-vei2232]MDV5088631.1 inorganic phosphate transporter [Veillonella sp. YH-vei2233]